MKFCIAGKNIIAIRAVEHLISILNINTKDILICANREDQGLDTWQPSLKKYAIQNKIKLVELSELYNHTDLLFFSLEFDKIININKFKTNKLYNIHFSYLPKYKGMYTSLIPILNGEKSSGVTLHIIDDGIDTGDIIDQYKFRIGISDTCKELYIKYLKYGIQLFEKNIDGIINNTFTSKMQGKFNSSYYSRKSIDFKNIVIDLNKTSFEIHNNIRAYIFSEFQLPEINGKKIIKSSLTSEKVERKLYLENDNGILLSGIDGYKIILETLK